MKKLAAVFFTFHCFIYSLEAQVVGTPYMVPTEAEYVLDQIVGVTPAFAFSTRKLKKTYTGFALKLRHASNSSEVNVAFDENDVVSGNSLVTYTYTGTSGVALGTTTTLTAYKGTANLFVTTWYDQSGNTNRDGVQPTASRQPLFVLASAGSTNQYASLQFTGTSKHSVVVNQTLNTLLTSGIRGSVFINAKVQNGTTSNNSFGHSDSNDNNIRWSAHMNWPSDNLYMYTDLGSQEGTRNFLNNSTVGLGKYKQYSIIRLSNSKIVRVSGVNKNNSALTKTSQVWQSNSTFGVGMTTGSLDVTFGQNGFTGNMSEFILYSTDLNATQYQTFESNQISFWGSN